MKKPWSYHGECCALGGPAVKTLGACGPSGFGLGTSLGTTFTMIPPRLFQIMSQECTADLSHSELALTASCMGTATWGEQLTEGRTGCQGPVL